MRKPTVERVLEAGLDEESTIVALWALTQYHYRQPEGDRARAELRARLGEAGTEALAMVTGLCGGPVNRLKAYRILDSLGVA